MGEGDGEGRVTEDQVSIEPLRLFKREGDLGTLVRLSKRETKFSAR